MKIGFRAKYIILIISILLIVGSVYFFYPRDIKFDLVDRIDLNKENVDHDCGFLIITNNKGLESKFKMFNILKQYKSLVNFEMFDFTKNDYLVTYGKELKKLTYNWHFVFFVDDNYYWFKIEHWKRIPLKAIYIDEKNIGNYICIYKIKKGRYT